jgi:hypothetical protein
MARETCAVFHKMVWLGRIYTTLPAQCVYTKDGFPAEILGRALKRTHICLPKSSV